jgi:hypothetical protein
MICKTILIALLLTGTAFAKDRAWQTGKLLDIQTERVMLRGSTTGDQRFHYTIESGNLIYTVSHYPNNRRVPAFYDAMKPAKPANLTIKGPVKFAIEKNKFYLQDDDGRDLKVELVKKAFKN